MRPENSINKDDANKDVDGKNIEPDEKSSKISKSILKNKVDESVRKTDESTNEEVPSNKANDSKKKVIDSKKEMSSSPMTETSPKVDDNDSVVSLQARSHRVSVVSFSADPLAARAFRSARYARYGLMALAVTAAAAVAVGVWYYNRPAADLRDHYMVHQARMLYEQDHDHPAT